MTIETAARRALERFGDDAELTNYESDGDDDHGTHWVATADSPVTVTARVVRGDTSQTVRDGSGVDTEIDAEIFVKDSVTGIRDGGGESATEVVTNPGAAHEQAYVVLQLDDQGNGLYRLLCVRDTS